MPKKKETKVETEEQETVEPTEEVVEVAEVAEEDVAVEAEVLEKPKKKAAKAEKPEVKKEAEARRVKRGKKYRNVVEQIEKGREYSLEDAIDLLKKTAVSKFDSSVEIHVNLNVDPSNADHQVRGSVLMPAGLGKDKKVAVVASVEKEKEAKDAGADFVGGQDIIEKIEKGWLGFDVLVATPDMMPHVGKIGKILGTKGLMPNPKVGTVTTDVAKAIKEIKKGRANYKIDKSGILHAGVGKVSFKNEDLAENIKTFMDAIHHAKPASMKGTFIKTIHLTTTMGPSVKLEK